LDASAAICLLDKEVGAEVVEDHVRRDPGRNFIHALTVCEVCYHTWRIAGPSEAETIFDDLEATGIHVMEDMDTFFVREVGMLKAVHRRVSLADCCALALARRYRYPLLTTDRHELSRLLELEIAKIVFIR
jgi:PIN domain nuclease of toxin-antitoxin system